VAIIGLMDNGSAPRVMPFIGEFRPAGMAEHVRMNATEADHQAQMDAPPKLPAHAPSDPSPRSTSEQICFRKEIDIRTFAYHL
jgi:hypothetical protein